MQASHKPSGCLANYIVISLIPMLFFISMILGYIGLLPLNVPIHALLVIGFILLIFLLFIKHNANYTICKMRSQYTKLEIDLHEQLLINKLTIAKQTKSILDMDTYLHEYYANVRNENFVSVASSIFPMLGILGTFVAIAISMPDFSVKDTDALDNEISILLSGVGSAFFASIYGILLSLIWTYFEKSGLSKADKFYFTIKRKFRNELWSQDELTIYKYTQYDIKENKFIQALKEVLNLEFIEKINTQHLQGFQTIMNETSAKYTIIAKQLQESSDKLSETLSLMDTSETALIARINIDQSLNNFTQATQEFEKTTKVFSAQLNNSLNRSFEKIDAEIGDIVIQLADFATHVSLESREVQESIKNYHHMLTSQLKDR